MIFVFPARNVRQHLMTHVKFSVKLIFRQTHSFRRAQYIRVIVTPLIHLLTNAVVKTDCTEKTGLNSVPFCCAYLIISLKSFIPLSTFSFFIPEKLSVIIFSAFVYCIILTEESSILFIIESSIFLFLKMSET